MTITAETLLPDLLRSEPACRPVRIPRVFRPRAPTRDGQAVARATRGRELRRADRRARRGRVEHDLQRLLLGPNPVRVHGRRHLRRRPAGRACLGARPYDPRLPGGRVGPRSRSDRGLGDALRHGIRPPGSSALLSGFAFWAADPIRTMGAEPGLESTQTSGPITLDWRAAEVLAAYPESEAVFLRHGCQAIRKPAMRRTAARRIALAQACRLRGVEAGELLEELRTAAAGAGGSTELVTIQSAQAASPSLAALDRQGGDFRRSPGV